MSARTAPTNEIQIPNRDIDNNLISTTTLQRAWCLLLTRSVWPTIDPLTAKSIAHWMMNGQVES